MGFMDELKRLAHPYEDEDEDGVYFEECPLVCVVGVVGLFAGTG